MKKRLFALLAAASAVCCALAACSENKPVFDGKSDPFDFEGNMIKPDVIIDGRDDDELWKGDDVAKLQFSSCTVSLLRRPTAIYAFFKVQDTTNYFYYDKGDADEVTYSDSVELYVNVDVNTRTATKQAGCYMLNLGRDNRTRIMSAQMSETEGIWYAWAGMYTFETRQGKSIDGEEEYYFVELMLPVAQLGIGETEDVAIALGHVDRPADTKGKAPNADFFWAGVPGVDPQISSSYRVLRATGGPLLTYAEYDAWKARNE